MEGNTRLNIVTGWVLLRIGLKLKINHYKFTLIVVPHFAGFDPQISHFQSTEAWFDSRGEDLQLSNVNVLRNIIE